MVLRSVFLWVAAIGLTCSAWADPKCACCGRFITDETVYELNDRAEGGKATICGDCVNLPRHCALCQLPVKDGYKEVGDGRFLCARDAQVAVLEPERVRRILADIRPELDRFYARFLTLPRTNVVLNIENQVHMDQVLQSPGFERQCPYLYGYARSLLMANTRWDHTIGILSAMPKSRLIGVYVHELAHAWLKENVSVERKLAQKAVEGFCELMAYRFLESLGETAELKAIRENSYTEGQLALFLEAYRAYDLQRILEWLQYGTDPYLMAGDLDRIRNVDLPKAKPLPEPVYRNVETAAPDELVLRGITGSGANRLALINNAVMASNEVSKVRVGTNTIQLRCLEIRVDSVVVQPLEGGERVVLKLKQ